MKFCILLCIACLGLSSCSMPTAETSLKTKPTCSFVPFYSEEEMLIAQQTPSFDSQAEQLYVSSNPTTTSFKTVTFATDSYTVKGETNLLSLQQLVQYLQKHPLAQLYIEGHTDERGTAAYNMALGLRRANAVKDYLVKQGILTHRLHTISFGKEHPSNPDHNETAWQQNRRTEFKIYAQNR